MAGWVEGRRPSASTPPNDKPGAVWDVEQREASRRAPATTIRRRSRSSSCAARSTGTPLPAAALRALLRLGHRPDRSRDDRAALLCPGALAGLLSMSRWQRWQAFTGKEAIRDGASDEGRDRGRIEEIVPLLLDGLRLREIRAWVDAKTTWGAADLRGPAQALRGRCRRQIAGRGRDRPPREIAVAKLRYERALARAAAKGDMHSASPPTAGSASCSDLMLADPVEHPARSTSRPPARHSRQRSPRRSPQPRPMPALNRQPPSLLGPRGSGGPAAATPRSLPWSVTGDRSSHRR